MANTPGTREKKQLILAGALLVLLIPLVLWNLGRAQAKKAKPKKESLSSQILPEHLIPRAVPARAEKALETETSDLAILKAKAAQIKWGQDPFVLDLGDGEELPALQLELSGIIYDGVHPEATYAIINGEVVRIGDDIRGIKVIDIEPAMIRLKKFNQEFSLYLYEKTEGVE